MTKLSVTGFVYDGVVRLTDAPDVRLEKLALLFFLLLNELLRVVGGQVSYTFPTRSDEFLQQ